MMPASQKSKDTDLSHIRTCYVVALAAEAAPLLASTKWTQLSVNPFRIWQTEDALMIISGIGKTKAAAATGYLGSLVPDRKPVWINFGTAGHADAPGGTGFLAHKITDMQTHKNYYPLRVAYQSTETLQCYDTAQDRYPPNCLVDMESAGFFPTAGLFTHHELIYVYKVVSDGASHQFQKEHVFKLIQDNLSNINKIRQIAEDLAERNLKTGEDMEQKVNEWLAKAADTWHLSFTKRHQLTDLLRRWFVLRYKQDATGETSKTGRNATKDLSPFALPAEQKGDEQLADFIERLNK